MSLVKLKSTEYLQTKWRLCTNPHEVDGVRKLPLIGEEAQSRR